MPTFSRTELERKCTGLFAAAGLTDEEAAQIAHSLVLANLLGHESHGVIRVVQYLEQLQSGHVRPGRRIRSVREADASAVVDGDWGFGQTVCHQAMQLAVKKAQTRSVGAVELFNSSHIGRLGEYVERAANEDIVAVVTCNNHGGGALQAPFGGLDPRMSPNPIAVGIPTGTDCPVVVDMTSSVVAEGKIRVQRNKGADIPEGWAIDQEGLPITDPVAFYGPPRGAILPFGGLAAHKGYALAMVVDILSGALGGSGCTRPGVAGGGNSVFLLALDIQAFVELDIFLSEVNDFIASIKSSRLMPGFETISYPGESEYRLRQERQKYGIDLDVETWRQLEAAGNALGVDMSRD